MFCVHVNLLVVIVSPCATHATNVARFLARARDSTHREAMGMLIDEMGFCEDYAEVVWAHLQGETMPEQPTHDAPDTLQ